MGSAEDANRSVLLLADPDYPDYQYYPDDLKYGYKPDASVMPNIIRANTNATTIMIGERAADWLLHG